MTQQSRHATVPVAQGDGAVLGRQVPRPPAQDIGRAGERPAGEAPKTVPSPEDAVTGAAAENGAAVAIADGAPALWSPRAAAESAAAPGSPEPGGPHHPGAEFGSVGDDGVWRARRHRRLARLSIGRHVISTTGLDQLQLARTGCGLVLGRDQVGATAAVRLFRPEPTRIVLLGDRRTVRFVALRALRFGARVVAFTPTPADWVRLGVRATGRTDRVAALAPDATGGPRGDATAPVLRLREGGSAPSAEPLPAWHTELVLVPALAADCGELLRSADLVLVRRLDHVAAAAVASARALPKATASTLQVLHEDMLGVLADAACRYLWTTPDEGERSAMDNPG